ncbi:MAG: 6,7-dimethyl-8-ribityllumazine synthase [Saprospiraceae bacterium]
MASTLKNLSSYDENVVPSGKDFSIGIVVADWNAHVTHKLYSACYETLIKHGVQESNILASQVPGAFELPVAAKIMLNARPFDAIVCLGCVIKGETQHDEYINHAVAQGLINLSIMSGKPIIFGVLTPNNEQQAVDRSGGLHGNKGDEAAITALRMIDLQKQLKTQKSSIGFTS